MQYNKGMLSNSRQTYEEMMEKRSAVEKFTGLMNRYHSVKLRDLNELEKKELELLLRSEINKLRNALPSYYKGNIGSWINSREEWLNRG